MKNEEEIKADFWTRKIALLKNMLHYGAPTFPLEELHTALKNAGWTDGQVVKTSTRSFFGTECPTLRLSLCIPNDIAIIQNPGIHTLEMTIQDGQEPVSLTGASIDSLISMLRAYTEHFPRYREALEKLLHSFRNAAKEEAKRQKIKSLALSNLHLMIPTLFKNSPYHPYLKTGETEATLYIRLQAGKTMEIRLPYTHFQTIIPRIHPAIAHYEKALAESPLHANLSDVDYLNETDFTPESSPNK